MNKDVLNQLSADEQPLASTLNSLIDDLQISQSFEWDLETQLMDKANTKMQPAQNWFSKFMIPVGWIVAAVGGVLLLNWAIRSLVPNPMVAATPVPEISFETSVRNGSICSVPLALAHGFDVFLTNPDKTDFVTVDPEKTIAEVRSFNWSPDGKQLALFGNTTGNDDIIVTDPVNGKIDYRLSGSGAGYVMGAAWSRDEKQFVLWSGQNNKTIYLLNADGSGLVEKEIETQILGTPQFTPDGKSIVFYGANTSSSGLFEVSLESLETRLINALVEDESAFAFSRDGLHLAYVAMDRNSGGAVLMVEDLETHAITALPGSLPIPKGSGSSIPDAANLSWSPDGKSLLFDFGRGATDRTIYLAHLDGKELIKVMDTAYAPSLSPDGKCLAYIGSDKQVYLLDFTALGTSLPMLLADLPSGRGIANYRLDKLQWRP